MKHFLFLISLYLFATSVVRGQSEKPDSLFRLLREGIIDTQQFFVNKEIGNFYQYQNGSRALFYYEKALKLAKQLKRPLEEANTHYSLGYSFRLQGEYDKALQAYLEAVRLYDALNDDRRLVNTWLSMISVYAETKKYKQAHDCVSKARELIERRQDSSQLSELYSQSGNIYFAEQKPELALSELSKGLEVAQSNNDDYGILTCLANIGLMHKQLGNPDKALRYLKEALQAVHDGPADAESYSYIYNNLGAAYAATGKYPDAKKMFDSSIHYALRLGARSLEYENYRNLADMYGAMGNYKEESYYLKKFYALKDSILSADSRIRLTELESEYLLEKKDVEILKQDVRLQKERNQRNLFILISLSSLLVLSLALLAYRRLQSRRKKLEEKNQVIAQQKSELESLNTIKDRLFGVISHDLRNPMVTLQSYLQLSAQTELSEEERQTFLQRTSHVLQQTKQLLDNLLAWARIQLGQTQVFQSHASVEDIVAQVRYDISLQMEQKNLKLEVNIEPGVLHCDEQSMVIILRNLLVNAIKFSDPGQNIILNGRQDSSAYYLEVKDRGKGIDAASIQAILSGKSSSATGTGGEKGHGLGLQLVQDILHSIHGTLDIQSILNEGTSVCLTLPSIRQTPWEEGITK